MVRALLNKNLWKVLSQRALKTTSAQVARGSHAVAYRTAPYVHPMAKIGGEVVSAAMWWWVFWHLWHEYEHITGEFPYPDAKAWTNKELGIPADDA